MKTVLQKDIEYFIEDFEKSSQIELVEGREKSELEKIAEARGMKIKGSLDLAMFKTIYGFTDRPNKNGAILPQKELLKVLPQIIGKPISVNHNRRFVVGHYVDYKYIQKSNQIIAYGVFYKNSFQEEWEKAKQLFKKKKLSSSFEIWSPTKAKKYREDGTYELHKMEIAGGALIFQDKDNEPAFEGADVLALGHKEHRTELELVYSSKYKENEILKSNEWKKSIEENQKKLEVEKETEIVSVPKEEKEEAPKIEEVKVEEPKVEEKIEEPTVPKVTCSNCKEIFETIEVTNIKCPKCFSIINKLGELLYPPQISDFSIECPSCSMRDWLIVKNEEDKSDIRCKSCAKTYVITFAQEKKSDVLDKIKFLYIGRARCPQCGNYTTVSGASDYTNREINCKKCGLIYNVDTHKVTANRTIKSIVIKSSEERGEKEMDKKEEIKVEDKKLDSPKTEDLTPKAEEKVEVKIEDKKEEVTKSSVEKAENTNVRTSEEKIDDKTIIETPKPSEELIDNPKSQDSQEKSSTETKEEAQDETPENKTKDTVNQDEELEISEIKKAQKIEKFDCECIKCGHKMSSSEHCKDLKCPECSSQMRRAKRPGDGKEKAKEVDTKINKLREVIKKAVRKIMALKKATKLEKASITAEVTKSQDEVTKIKKEAEEKIEFYKANAKTIVERREDLGHYADDISDKDMVNDDVYTKIKLEKENAKLRALAETDDSTDIVSAKKSRDESFYSKTQNEITKKAFRRSQK